MLNSVGTHPHSPSHVKSQEWIVPRLCAKKNTCGEMRKYICQGKLICYSYILTPAKAASIVADASSSVRFFWTVMKASRVCPTSQSSKSSIPIPHSSPAFTCPEDNLIVLTHEGREDKNDEPNNAMRTRVLQKNVILISMDNRTREQCVCATYRGC